MEWNKLRGMIHKVEPDWDKVPEDTRMCPPAAYWYQEIFLCPGGNRCIPRYFCRFFPSGVLDGMSELDEGQSKGWAPYDL